MDIDRLDAKKPPVYLEQLQSQVKQRVDMQKEKPIRHDETLLNQKRPFTPYLIAFAGVVGFVPWMVNFDGGFSGVVLAMPSFNNAFGSECRDMPTGKSCMLTATEQSLLAIPYLFQAVGGALAGILGANVGRRVAINIGCLVVIVGAAVMIGIDSYAKFLVGKCISGVGLGLLLGVGIVYGTECIPAPNVKAQRHKKTTSVVCETDEVDPRPEATAAKMSMHKDMILKPASKDPRHPRYSKHQGVSKVPARMQHPRIRLTTNTFEMPTSCKNTVAYVRAN